MHVEVKENSCCFWFVGFQYSTDKKCFQNIRTNKLLKSMQNAIEVAVEIIEIKRHSICSLIYTVKRDKERTCQEVM